MKINKIFYTIILLIMLVMIINPSRCFALGGPHKNQVMVNDGGGGGAPGSETGVPPGENPSTTPSTTVTGDPDQNLPTLDDRFKPEADLGSGQSMVEIILSILTVIGVLAVVIGIALIGFGSILGSAGEKAEAQTKLVGIVIAGIIIMCGSMLARTIMSLAETMG